MRELTDPELALCRKDKGRAVELKDQGNACFSRREFGEALRFYSQVCVSYFGTCGFTFTFIGVNCVTAVEIE
jgi:hypothetical protein